MFDTMKPDMKRIMIILAAVLLFAIGCDKTDTGGTFQAPADFVEVSEEHLAAGPDGCPFEVTVSSSEDWRINGGAEWVKPSSFEGKNGDKVTFTVDPNESSETLETVFKIFAGSAVKTISVVSSPEWYLEMYTGKIDQFSRDGGKTDVLLDTNIPVEAIVVENNDGSEEWIELESKVKGMKYTRLTFSVKPTELYRERNATLTVKGFEKTKEINISQNKKTGFFVDTKNIDVDNQAHEISFYIRTNSPSSSFTLSADKSWISSLQKGQGEIMEDGLTRYTCTASLGETQFSRKGNITVKSTQPRNEYTIGISQINPNPLTATIPDPKFAKWLIQQGYINESMDGSDKYELLEAGTTVTRFEIGYNFMDTDIDEISGLSGFPKLKELQIIRCSVKRIDISGVKLKNGGFYLSECHDLEYVNMGDQTMGFQFQSMSINSGSNNRNQWQSAESFTLVQPKTGYIGLNCNKESLKDKEKLKTIDVTGCYELKSLEVDRSYGDYCVLETIYVTQEQYDKYQKYLETGAVDWTNGTTLGIKKNEKTQVVVKP